MSSERPAAELGSIGDRVIFENESIRVWSFSVGPGGLKHLHRHELPYLIVPLTGGSVEITTESGVVRSAEDRPGAVIWQEAGEVHELRNVGATPYENVLVELKREGAGLTG
jgi:beta-alanine degradation protein BauB